MTLAPSSRATRSLTAVAMLYAFIGLGCSKKTDESPNTRTAAGRAAAPAPLEQESQASVARRLAAATPEDPLRPEEPSRLIPLMNGPDDPSNEPPKLSELRMPPGFSVSIYSDKVPRARSLRRGAPGTVFVSTRKDDRVYALVDHDRDYRVDQVHTVAKGLDTPNGLAYHDGNLYVAETERVLRFDGIDGRLENPPDPVVIIDDLPEDDHHGARYIGFGPDGLLYIAVGAPCNNCLREEPIFATIARTKADGSGLEIFARGVRNSVGFDWHPTSKELWFTENGRDELGDDLPPDELNRATRAGDHFGFPYCHGGVVLDPEYGEKNPCTQFVPPVKNLGPHVAALGMRFYTGAQFPSDYENAVLLAEHGSWNREKKIGYRVMAVRLDGERAVSYEPLLEGFLDERSGEVWGRPVDVEVLEDGSLLVSDDWKGAVYRVTYSK